MSAGRNVVISLEGSGAVLAGHCGVAETFFPRLRGLIGRRELTDGEGLLFPRCNDIHMWFMSIPIDVVFLKYGAGGARREVSSTRENLRPWRLLPVRDGRASETLELPAGTVSRHGIKAGDIVCIA